MSYQPEASPGSLENGARHDDKKALGPDYEDRSSLSSAGDTQLGVKKLEGITTAWTKWSLIMAYVGLYLMACSTSLEQQTIYNYAPLATSSFLAHSLLSTVTVVQNVVLSVVKPPMSKIADVFGRLEAFSLCIFLYTIGYIQQAASNNVKTYAAAQIFYSAGQTGVQILQQIFIADTTDLRWRALMSSIPDLPFLWSVWAGSPLAARVLATTTWRWGYAMWAIILPVCFIPLGVSLFINQRKAHRMGIMPRSPYKDKGIVAVLKSLWFELDVFGLLLLANAISLILIPLTLAPRANGGWSNASMIAMIVIGCVSLVVFPFWERSKKLAPFAFFPRDLFRNRTVLAGTAIAFFYFMAFYLSVYPYFYSYLLIVPRQSITAAGHITQTFSFASTVASIAVSVIIKYTGHYKYFVTIGSAIYMIGIGLMMKYRSATASTAAFVGTQIMVGVGGGFLNVPAQLGVQASASHQQVAAATAVFLTILEIGGAVGSAISGSIWSTNIPRKLAAYLPPESADQASLIFGNITLATSGWAEGTPTKNAINQAYSETMHLLLIAALCCCIPLFPLSLLMKNYDLKTMDQKVKGNVIGNNNAETSHMSEYGTHEPLDGRVDLESPRKQTLFNRLRGR